MSAITLRGHFDGEKIQLDDPYDLKPNTRLIITVLANERLSDERDVWLRNSAAYLTNAYGIDEPDYPTHMIKEPNPEYDSGK